MVALTNKLSSIYQSNQNLPSSSSQLNQNVGQLMGRMPTSMDKTYNNINMNANIQKVTVNKSMHAIPINVQKTLNKTLNLHNYSIN